MKFDFPSKLSSYISHLRNDYNLPGVSIAVLNKGEIITASSGILNTATQVESTIDSVFQVGSITKVFTTTLIMQLVDNGDIDLDRPVIDYLCDFKVGCEQATKSITVRQLVNHTNGMAGDFFAADKPSGGNHLARYIDRCDLLPQAHPPGQCFSYSNSAFCIAGRLLEVITGKTWHQLIREQIVDPLLLKNVVITGGESSRFRVARGHVWCETAKEWLLANDGFPRGMDPVGSSLAMSATELVRFAKSHLDASRGLDAVLSKSGSQQMQGTEVLLPAHSPFHATGWGLGWSLYQENGLQVFGHDGSTVGQCAMLRVVPEHDLIFAVQVNCDVFMTLMPTVYRDLMKGFAGLDYVEAEPELGKAYPLKAYCGRYESLGQDYEVFLQGDSLRCHVVIKNEGREEIKWLLKPINNRCFATYTNGGTRSLNIHFMFDEDKSAPSHLSAFYRLNKRVA